MDNNIKTYIMGIGLIILVVGGGVFWILADYDYLSSDFLTSPNATWHLAGNFSNNIEPGEYSNSFDIKGSKIKVKATASIDPNGEYNKYAKFDVFLGKPSKSRSGSYTAKRGEIEIVTFPNNTGSGEIIANNFNLFGTEKYNIGSAYTTSKITNWTVEVYDYY